MKSGLIRAITATGISLLFVVGLFSTLVVATTYTGSNSYLRIEVQELREIDSVGDHAPNIGCVFVEIYAKVTVTGAAVHHVNPYYFVLFDKEMDYYSLNEYTFLKPDYFGDALLSPSEYEGGWIVFEMSANREPYLLGFSEEFSTNPSDYVFVYLSTQQQVQTAPLYPAFLKIPSKVTDRSATITWNQSTCSDFSKYEIYVSQNSSSLGAPQATITDRMMTISNLNNLSDNTTYYVLIKTMTSTGQSADSNTVSFTTAVKNFPPVKVVGITTIEKTSTSITVSWQRYVDNDFKRYEIYVSKSPSSLGDLKISIIHQNLTQYKIDNLNWETQYYVTIRSVDAFDLHTDSDPTIVSTAAPTNTEMAIGFTGLVFLIALIDFIPGYWVYRNAQKRNSKKPHLWFLIVLFTSILGFVVYLMKRPRQQT